MKFKILLSLLFLPLTLFARQLPEGWTLQPAEREVRAVWFCTLGGMDWPGRNYAQTEYKAEYQRELLCRAFDRLQQAGINTILFQTRIRSTVAYPSKYEPWDGAFSGTPGVAPPYDVLKFATEEAHRRGMELHAYLVAFPICSTAQARQLGRQALPVQRTDLCRLCGDRWMMDPGVPATAHYIAGMCREIVENYEVDGIHLDYIRYPEKEIPFNDDATYARYGKGAPKAQWRRDNVTRTMRLIRDTVKAVRPWMKISCSPIGKYADLPRQHSRGWNARDAVFQDAQQWLKEGIVDMLFPMMYFDNENFYPFLYDWQQHANERPIVPGLAAYFLSPNEGKWTLPQISRQLQVARSIGIGGQAFFRSQFLLDNHKGIYDFVRHFNRQPALTPAMTWADSIPPATPVFAQKQYGDVLRLWWNAVRDATPITYNIYRIDANGKTLLAHHLRTHFYDLSLALPSAHRAQYVVVAMDAYGNESYLPEYNEKNAPVAHTVGYPSAFSPAPRKASR